MAPADPDLQSTAYRIVGALVADRVRVVELATEVNRWVVAHGDDVGDHGVAWAASRAVTVGLDALAGGDSSALRADQVELLRNLPVAAQVAVALHHFLELGLDDVARLTARPVEEVRALVGTERGTAPPPPPDADARPVDLPAPPHADAPEAEPAPAPPAPAPPSSVPPSSVPPAPVPPAPVVAVPGPFSVGDPAAAEPPPPPTPSLPVATGPLEAATRPGATVPPAAPLPPAPTVPPAAPVPPAAEPPARARRRRSSRSPKERDGGRRHTRVWVVAVVVVLALVAAGIALSARRDDAKAPATPKELASAVSVRRDQLSPGCATPAGDVALDPQEVRTSFDGQDRSYRIVAPAAISPGIPRPVVVDLSDLGQPVGEHLMESRFDQLATALKLVVITPTPPESLQWNVLGTDGGPDDLGFIRHVLQTEAKHLCIDQTRIVLAGRGAGAHLAASYACSHPGEVAGIVMIAGVIHPSGCKVDDRLSILALTGSKDDVYPMNGGTGAGFDAIVAGLGELTEGADYEVASVRRSLDAFADDLDCEGNAKLTVGFLTLSIDTGCHGDGEIWRGTLDAGHEWFPATYDVLVQFFTSWPLAPE